MVAGSHINSVGTPSVSASTSGSTTTFTFNYLKGNPGNSITGPTGPTGSTGPTGPTGPAGAITNACVYSTSAPSHAAGKLWFNPNLGYLQISSGSSWVAVGAVWK